MTPHHLAHWQLLDSALPVGAFAHSFGLETLVQEERVRSARGLKEFLETMLFCAWAPCDCMAIKGAYLYAEGGQWEELWRLDNMMNASRPAREAREGLQKMGRQLLRLAHSIHPQLQWEPFRGAVEAGRCVGAYPTVYAWATRALGIPQDEAATGYLYACTLAATNNAVRLSRLGQTEAQTVLASLLPSIPEAWDQVKDRDPFDFASATPATEIAMMRHEQLYSRLFMS